MPDLDHIESPNTRAAALAFVRAWRASTTPAEYQPDNLAGQLQADTAAARAAFRQIDGELLRDDQDQLLALVNACGTLARAVEFTIEQLRMMSALQDAEQLLGGFLPFNFARRGSYKTLADLDAAVAAAEPPQGTPAGAR